MKKRNWARRLSFWTAMILTAMAGAAFPLLRAHVTNAGTAVPPGVRAAQRQLVTVWITDGLPGTAQWLQAQATAFARQTPGTSVWLRNAGPGEIADLRDAPPDLLVFSAASRAPAGKAEALCLSGYALLAPDAAASPAPRSLFGLTPTPDPAVTPAPADFVWPERFMAEEGFGPLALAALDAPQGGAFGTAQETKRFFSEGGAVILSVTQAAGLTGYRVLAAVPATDRIMYIMPMKENGAAESFLSYLLSPAAQRGLSAQRLLPAAADMRLYGSDEPLLQALEAALAQGWRAPAFLWPDQKEEMRLTAQALYRQGESAAGLLKIETK